MTSQPRDKTRDSTKHDTAKFGIDLYTLDAIQIIQMFAEKVSVSANVNIIDLNFNKEI